MRKRKIRPWFNWDPIRKKKVKRKIYDQQGGRCCYCLVHMEFKGKQPPRPTEATFEHLTDAAKIRGRTLEDDVALACRECNQERGSREHIRRQIAERESR